MPRRACNTHHIQPTDPPPHRHEPQYAAHLCENTGATQSKTPKPHPQGHAGSHDRVPTSLPPAPARRETIAVPARPTTRALVLPPASVCEIRNQQEETPKTRLAFTIAPYPIAPRRAGPCIDANAVDRQRHAGTPRAKGTYRRSPTKSAHISPGTNPRTALNCESYGNPIRHVCLPPTPFTYPTTTRPYPPTDGVCDGIPLFCRRVPGNPIR